MLEIWDFRVWERMEEREGEERETSRWREWERASWWVLGGKGEVTWKWSEETEAERKVWRRAGVEEEKEEPTRETVMGTERERERREEGVGGGRWGEERERGFLREEGR